ncbi:MAG TPA: hypothetical protein DEG43_05790 [Acidimicrobiaceae bacterium]|nr:hypothetical protein [Acidimicrobiaceae bacterium]
MTTNDRRTRRTPKELIKVVVPLLLVWTIGTGVLLLVASQPDDRIAAMLLDPSFSLGNVWYTGLISNLGILGWTTAVVCALTGSWLCGLGGRLKARRFLFSGSIVGAVFLFDDLFQFHAILVPAEIGIPKAIAESALVAIAVWWTVSNLREIGRTHTHLLLAAGVGLCGSFVVDILIDPAPGNLWLVAEDGAKFLGILAWATYFVVTARDICRSVFTEALMVWPDEAYDEVFGAGAYEQRLLSTESPAKV